MTLTIGVLSWGAHNTLINTLESYKFRGLDKLADQRIIWFQEMSPVDIEIAKAYDYEYAGSPDNIGIAGGYRELVERATGSLFLFLENDWELIENPHIQIAVGAACLSTCATDVVRYRHRLNPGHPLWTSQFRGNEMSRPEHLLDSVHWEEHPEKFVTDYGYHPIESLPMGWYITDSRFANWTNNPTMFRTSWIKNLSNRFGGADVERDLQTWWQEQPFNIMQGDGLFTHNRIG